MRIVLISAAAAALLAACTPPEQRDRADRPDTPGPGVVACNEVAPDLSRQVRVEDAIAVAAADLRGGRITPGTYDLASATRTGQATGWSGTRAVALDITEETQGGVVFNWAGAAPSGDVDRWTAQFTETPEPRVTYTCGRTGEVSADFSAEPNALQLQIPDGANGSLVMNFERRS